MRRWNQSGFSPDSIPWNNLSVSVRSHVICGIPSGVCDVTCDLPLPFLQMCSTLEGEFLGPACGHHGPYIPDVLFWSIILFFTTFFLSSFLKQFKTERYFPTKVSLWFSDGSGQHTFRSKRRKGAGMSMQERAGVQQPPTEAPCYRCVVPLCLSLSLLTRRRAAAP